MGGMGGGMGGMGGGGMFNVPDALPAPARRGLFAVADDLKLSSKKSAAKPAEAPTGKPTVAPQAKAARPVARAAKQARPLSLAIPAGQDAETAWNDYFANQADVSAAALRATVLERVSTRKLDEAQGLIRAALRNGKAQPWMYEALGLILQMQNKSRSEIERALLSAVDFAVGPNDLLTVAAYMARTGHEQRALKIYRQVSEADPYRPEPYVQGLQLSKRVDDLDGIRWATVGILRQAWPKDREQIAHHALRVAEATLARLKGEGRTQEMEAFEQELNKAMTRDCVVQVSWDGEADVDLLVEEPTGSVCSFRNPRTTAGGVMIGDTVAGTAESSAKGLSEAYVCPEAFAGAYRVLLRKVWGKVAGDKVTVDVYTHFRDQKAQHFRKQIPLGDDDAAVVFELPEGRRQEPLAQRQLVNAAEGQMALNRAIIAQQLEGVRDDSSLAAFAASRGRGAFAVANANRFRPGVGYMPVIEVLPEGALMFASAVVSADRRYVRISPSPQFSTIRSVTTFSIEGGATNTAANVGGAGGGAGGGLGGGGGGGGLGGGGGGGFF
jgi:hypothetical protein